MGVVDEFKAFVNRGNVVDLAVGVILGVAFIDVVNAVVQRVLTPIIGLLFGEPNFDAVGQFGCGQPATDASGNVVAQCAGSIGAVLTALVSFVLVAVALFFVVKAYNRLQDQAPEAPVPDPEDVVLLREIRDALVRDDR